MAELRRHVGEHRIYPTETFAEKRRDNFLQASERLLELRTQTALHLLGKEPWDFFIAVFFDTDRILHQLWHYLDPAHPYWGGSDRVDLSHFVWRYFQRVNQSIGRLLDGVDEDTLVLIMSDHGMGAAHNFIVLNNWLLEVGLLRLKDDQLTKLKRQMFGRGFTLRRVHQIVDRLGLAKHAEYRALYSVDGWLKLIFLSFADVDWSKSRAYSFGRHTGAVYINLEGREPQGIVEPGEEYERVRDEVARLAGEFTDPRTGRRLVGQVLRREELYTGPHVDQAPDLTLLPRRETDIFFGLADFGSRPTVDTVYRYSGMHRQHGLLLMRGPQIRKNSQVAGASIVDLAPTILYAMGLPVPQDMDGEPLLTAFEGEYVRRNPVQWTSGTFAVGTPTGASYTKEEEQEIEQRLRELGYLG